MVARFIFPRAATGRIPQATAGGASRAAVAAILAPTPDWNHHVRREQERYREGSERLPDDRDQRQRQRARIANAAYGAGLASLMLGDHAAARDWLRDAAREYRESHADAPPESWGRVIGAIKASILAEDWPGAEKHARWALAEGAGEAGSAIGRYAATLAYLVLERYPEARRLADELRTDASERRDFPQDVGDALAMIAAGSDRIGYVEAIEDVLESFEQRDRYLEDVPVADTVLVLQALAERRELAVDLTSPLLPDGGGR